QQEERVQPAQHRVVGAVEVGLTLARALELRDPRAGALPEIRDWSELDGGGGTRLRARRLQAAAEAVVAERALLRGARHRVDVDDPEGAGADAVAAAVADVGLDDHR